jgi:lysophospholipase L1-like esterase
MQGCDAMKRTVHVLACVLATLLPLACASHAPPPEPKRVVDLPPRFTPPVPVGQFLQKGDRLLFVGDEVTQDMFYSRAVATALLPLLPDLELRVFNGGHEGATAGEALKWIDDLMGLCRPTVVFVCLGLNDAGAKAGPDEVADSYRQNLGRLVEKIKAREGVRQVIVLSPPAVQEVWDAAPQLRGVNAVLKRLGQTAREVATEKTAAFGDLFEHTYSLYRDATEQGVVLALLDGRRPGEAVHVVIASVVLRGLGVSSADLEKVNWSPLTPARMAPVRAALAMGFKPPAMEPAQQSRDLYLSLGAFDELFFRAWRVAGTHPSAPAREKVLAQSEGAWGQAVRAARGVGQ